MLWSITVTILDASSSLEFEYIVTYKLHKYLPLILQWLLSEPQVSYDDFVAAGSLGAAREKGLVNKSALLHLYILWFEKRAVKYMFIPCLICHCDCSWDWKGRIMLCRKAMSCFLDSTCDSSTKLQNLGFCKRQIGIIYFAHTVTNSFGLMTHYSCTGIITFLMRKNKPWSMIHCLRIIRHILRNIPCKSASV